MSTLIAVYNSEGCVGRCDGRCYDATEPECDCICGGRNHGVGLGQALANTEDLVHTAAALRPRMRLLGGDRLVIQPELPLERLPCP